MMTMTDASDATGVALLQQIQGRFLRQLQRTHDEAFRSSGFHLMLRTATANTASSPNRASDV